MDSSPFAIRRFGAGRIIAYLAGRRDPAPHPTRPPMVETLAEDRA